MASVATLIDLPVSRIVPDPANLREHFEDEDIDALGRNLLEQGQLDPIQVFERGDGTYDLYDGERRWRAAQRIGLGQLRAIVVERPSPADLLTKKVSRALQTRNLGPQEELAALESALDALGVRDQPDEWSNVAKRLGIPPELLRSRLRITQLARPVREEFERGDLDVSSAQALGRLEDKDRQTEVARFIKDNHLNTRFVGTKFIKHLTKNPDRPVMDVYTMALAEEREPRSVSSTTPKQQELADRLDDMLADFRRSETWLVSAGREGLLAQLNDRGDVASLQRLGEAVGRLAAICQSFVKSAGADPGSPKGDAKQLPPAE